MGLVTTEYITQKKDKAVKIINKQTLLRMIAAKTDYYLTDISRIMTALQEIVDESLLAVDETADVNIKLLEGINVTGTYIPPHEMENNINTATNFVDKTVFVKPIATVNYKNKIRDCYRQGMKQCSKPRATQDDGENGDEA